MIKNLFTNTITTLNTFTRIPTIRVDYNEDSTKFTYLVFPIIGIILGIIYYLVAQVMTHFQMNMIIMAIIMILTNLFVTGGIHFDGFVDTTDAFKSYRTKEQKQVILKDSLIGAFALIHFMIIILTMIVVYYYIFVYNLQYLFLIIPIITRIASIILPHICTVLPNDMLSDLLSADVKKYYKGFAIIYILITIAIAYFLKVDHLLLIFAAMTIVIILYTIFFKHQIDIHLGNLSGDLCGHYICMLEWILPLVTIIITIIFKQGVL